VIRLEHVSKTYRGRRGPVAALDDVSLQVAAGEFVAVRGPSGCGKSTLLLTIAGMIRPTGGTVTVRDLDLYALGAPGRTHFRAQNVGFVFQMFHLVPYLNVLDNVLLPARFARSGDRKTRALGLLERFGLQHRLEHFPAELSTGERQRTAIARALVNDPWLVLADEPTGNLDTETGASVMECLSEVHRAGKTIVLVTHDPAVDQHATRVVKLRAGRVEG
jgi:ABC-type lipoprotein export system ATPase subunit